MPRSADRTPSCREYVRAGAGLPGIEPGMPTPAGTGLTRRQALLRASGVALSVYGAGRLEAFDEGVAAAAEAAPDAPVLVTVAFKGGIDGLGVLAPVTDPRWTPSLRPTLFRDAEGTLAMRGSDELRWHPAAAALRTLHDEGKVTVLPAVGYPQGNQSHFTSRHFWQVGALDADTQTGWLGRYLDLVGRPDNPIQGLSLESVLSPTLATASHPVAAGTSSRLWSAPGVTLTSVRRAVNDTLGAFGRVNADDPVLAQVVRQQAISDVLRRQLSTTPTATSTPYPATPMGNRLKQLVGYLRAGLPIRCVALDANGSYDTHADQATHFERNLRSTAEAIAAFQADLESQPDGLARRVIVLVWSEFGRRAHENGSLGTDHGAAGVGFVIGQRASGLQLGAFPGLAALDRSGNIPATTDFRSVYASLLEQWLGTDAAAIIPGADGFDRLPVIA